jgi:chemotaxis protein CheD
MSENGAAPRGLPYVPPTFPGFERINRYYEVSTAQWIAQILPGDFYVTQNDEIISTVLGSCVSTCMRDARRGIGGMNHFMLPEDPAGREGSSARYGVFAMEQLINAFLTRGARRETLEIKIVGGGRVISGMGDVGRSNVEFVREFLEAEGMPIQVEDVGLAVARRVRYRVRTGQMRVLHLPVSQNTKIAARETELASRIREGVRRRPPVELF